MKNDFEVRGPVTAIFCHATPKAGGGLMETLISTSKLKKVQSWPGTWFPYIDPYGNTFIRGHKLRRRVAGFNVYQPLLHKVLADTPPGYKTNHKDSNTLNNTDENLVNVRIGRTYTETPARGVHWREDKQRYEVAAFYDKKRYNLGLFDKDKLTAANFAVEEFRRLGPEEYFEKYPKKKGAR